MEQVEAQGKKRKRTGKQREERKRERQAQEAKLVEGGGEEVEPIANAIAPEAEGEETREEAEEGALVEPLAAPAPPAPSINLEQLSSRIPQALKSLHPLFKQAKTFETRRLVKKVRFLRLKGETSSLAVTELEGQLLLLSHVQLNPIIRTHLLQKLKKHHSLKHLSLPDTISDQLEPSANKTSSGTSSASAELQGKVENRLCSAKMVAEGVKGAVGWLLGEEGGKLVNKEAAKGMAERAKRAGPLGQRESGKSVVDGADVEDDDDGEGGAEDDVTGDGDGPRTALHRGANSDKEDTDIDDEALAGEAGWESGSVSGGDDSEGDEDVEEGGIKSDDADAVDPGQSVVPKRAKLSLVTATKPTTSTDSSKSTKPAKPAKPAKPTKPSKPTSVPSTITSSLFLPSLSTGFTLGSDSDSDPDFDVDPDGIVGRDKGERKNRRGQRARQAIWEKKYGKNAKHVLKAQQEGEETQQQQDMQAAWSRGGTGPSSGTGTGTGRGAGTMGARGRGEGASGRGGAGGTGRGGWKGSATMSSRGAAMGGRATLGSGSQAAPNANLTPLPPPSRSQATHPSTAAGEGKSLHPSWEAAKLRKLKEGAGGGQAAKGTKIVFD